MTVSNQIIAVLDAICEKFGIVIDWTASNIMPYLQDLCKRIVTYEIATSVAWIVLQVVIVVLAFHIRNKKVKPIAESDGDDYSPSGYTIVCAIITVIAFIVICVQAVDIVRALTIPEITIYYFAKPFLKGVC